MSMAGLLPHRLLPLKPPTVLLLSGAMYVRHTMSPLLASTLIMLALNVHCTESAGVMKKGTCVQGLNH